MRLVSFRAQRKNSLIGFACVELPNSLVIDDCPVLTSGNGRAWAALPSKPQMRDGQHVEIDGRKQYVAMLKWPNRTTQDAWSDAVVALVREHHPEAFDGAAP
jgi:hypothetical protein